MNTKSLSLIIPLIGVIILDSILTWFLWNNNLMIEANPIMLWGLNKGANVYWTMKTIQVLAALFFILGRNGYKKLFKYGYSTIMLVYSVVMVNFIAILIDIY